MDSDTTITILGLLLLAAVFGLAFMARALEEARSHQQYLRSQVNKTRPRSTPRRSLPEETLKGPPRLVPALTGPPLRWLIRLRIERGMAAA